MNSNQAKYLLKCASFLMKRAQPAAAAAPAPPKPAPPKPSFMSRLGGAAQKGWNNPQQGLVPTQGADGKMKLIGNNPVARPGTAAGNVAGEILYGNENRRLGQNMSQEQLDQISR